MKNPILVIPVDLILRNWWLTGCEKKKRGWGVLSKYELGF